MLKHSYSYRAAKPIVVVALFFIITLVLINNSTTIIRMAYPIKYKDSVEKYSRQFNVDKNLVYAVIKAESSFSENAVSKKNAVGLMQITEKTGAWGAKTLNIENYRYESLFNPDVNIMIGCWYLSTLMKEFNNNLQLTLTAYNAGSGNVNQWLGDVRYSFDGSNLSNIPFDETQNYVLKVNEYYRVYKKLYEKN